MSLNTASQSEAQELLIMADKSTKQGLSARNTVKLVSVHEILCRNSQTSMYYQWFPNDVKVTDSQASAMILDESSSSKIIKIDIKTLQMRDDLKR